MPVVSAKTRSVELAALAPFSIVVVIAHVVVGICQSGLLWCISSLLFIVMLHYTVGLH